MRFTLLVAADLYGNKVNLELSFPTFPTISEIHRVVETTFAVESSALRPAGHPFVPFKVARFHVFDDRIQGWAELSSPSQLADYCQVYAFQRDGNESQKQIPPARLPTAARISAAVNAASPVRPLGVAGVGTPRQASPPASAPVSARQTSPARSIALPLPVSSPVTLPPAPNVPTRNYPDAPTFDQKVRTVFDETDVNQNRVIELDEFRRIMRILNIDLNAAAIADLFQRADADRDGVLSVSDFQSFAVNYPTLLDSLYFRGKEFWEDHKKKVNIDHRKQLVDDARMKERQAAQLMLDARNELAEQEQRLRNQESDLQQRLLREREIRQHAMEKKKELEKQQFERAEREQHVQGARERERQRQQQLSDSQKATEASERRVAGQEAEVARAQEKERQLEQMLADARRETERQARTLHILADELQQVRDREQQAGMTLADAHRDLQRLLELAAAAEAELSRHIELDREAETTLGETQRETARSAHRRDEEERALHIHRERENSHQRNHQDSVRNIEEAERALVALEQDYADYIARRQQIEQQELPLIEQEIRLREQRYSLEQMESRLKNEAMSFQSVTGRAAQAAAQQQQSLYATPRGTSPLRR
jgi:hypothetical protein